MKKVLLIGGAVFGALVLIVVIIGALAYFKGIGTGSKAVVVPNAAQYIAPTPTTAVGAPPQPTTITLPGQPTSTPRPVATATPAPVSFILDVKASKPAETSVFLNASVKAYLHADLLNTGAFEAHNVQVTARAKVDGEYISIDGKDALVIPIGTLAAKTRTTRDLSFTMKMSLSQGRSAQESGIFFEIVVTSNEANSYVPLMRCNEVECAPA